MDLYLQINLLGRPPTSTSPALSWIGLGFGTQRLILYYPFLLVGHPKPSQFQLLSSLVQHILQSFLPNLKTLPRMHWPHPLRLTSNKRTLDVPWYTYKWPCVFFSISAKCNCQSKSLFKDISWAVIFPLACLHLCTSRKSFIFKNTANCVVFRTFLPRL